METIQTIILVAILVLVALQYISLLQNKRGLTVVEASVGTREGFTTKSVYVMTDIDIEFIESKLQSLENETVLQVFGYNDKHGTPKCAIVYAKLPNGHFVH